VGCILSPLCGWAFVSEPDSREPEAYTSIRSFPFLLQGGEEVWAAVGAEEFVVFDYGGGADAGGREGMLDADDAGGEADADGVGESDVGREGESDFELGAGGDGAIKVEENAAGADVLSFGANFVRAFEPDQGGEAHVEAPHHPPVLCVRLHVRALGQ
jgi:hypothetical protein